MCLFYKKGYAFRVLNSPGYRIRARELSRLRNAAYSCLLTFFPARRILNARITSTSNWLRMQHPNDRILFYCIFYAPTVNWGEQDAIVRRFVSKCKTRVSDTLKANKILQLLLIWIFTHRISWRIYMRIASWIPGFSG